MSSVVHRLTGVIVWGVVLCGAAIATAQPAQSRARATEVGTQGPAGTQASLLLEKWGELGDARTLPLRLLERGEVLPVWAPRGDLDRAGCTTVVALGPPNLSFVFRFDVRQQAVPGQNWPVPSAAGLAEVTRCGNRRIALQGLGLQMRSPRGVVQILSLTSPKPPPPTAKLLPSRDAGTSQPSPEVGPPPALGPLKDRVQLRVQQYEGFDAAAVRQRSIAASATGQATTVLFFDPGCHVLDFLSEHRERRAADLDAHLTTLDGAQIIASDDTGSADASLSLCVGRPQRYRVSLRGAAPGTAVTAVHAEWPLPESLPLEWGPMARASLAEPLMHLGLLGLSDRPVEVALGVQGVTRMVVEVDPLACYAISMAAIRGQAQRLAIAARAGAVLREAQVSDHSQSGGLTFCAQGAKQATIETHSAGQGLAWLIGVWEIRP